MSELNQRHQLVLLFTDLTDSTRIAAQLEPEHYAELLSQLRQHTTTIIARHGGEVVRVDGDGALCIFGYPLTHEDAGRRATEAALDLHTAVTELAGETAVSLHSGIHAGVVLLRSGDLVRGRYEMLGDATNVAARLCDAAGPGGILVSEETLGADRHFFQTGPERSIALSGHGEPMRALSIVAREAVPHRFAAREIRGLSPFVGRQAERKTLLDWLESPAQPAPVMLVHGPAGIGKSRLLRVLAGDVGDLGWTVASGYCEGYLGAPPLQPLLQIAAILDPQFAAESGAAVRIEATVHASARRPLMLVIDDWQWADDASRSLIARLASDCPPNLRLLLFSRESDPGLDLDSSVKTVELGPLDRVAARATIDKLLAVKDPFAVARIDAATGGSPLLIEELCHAYAGSGRSVAESKLRGAWFDLSVQSRFASLAPDDAQLLRLAAVIGNVVAPWLLASVRGAAIDGAMLDRLQNADFLFPGDNGDLRFKHGLTRDAVYAAIGLQNRNDLHRRVLQALDQLAEVQGEAHLLDALAYHSASAGQVDRALPYAFQAGDAALAAGALDRAQRHYRSALELVERQQSSQQRDKQLWLALNKFGLACIVDPAADQLDTLEHTRRLFRQDRMPEGQVRSAYWIGAIAYGVGLGKRSVAALREAESLATVSGNHRHIEQIQIKLAQSLFASGDYLAARAQFEQVLPAIRQGGGNIDQEAAAYGLSCYGFMHADLGEFGAAEALFAETEAILRNRALPMTASSMGYRAATSLWRRDWQQAIVQAELAAAASKRHRTRNQQMMNSAKIAYARWQLDPAIDPVMVLENVATWLLAPGNSQQRASMVIGWLIEALVSHGEAKRARAWMLGIFGRIRIGGDRLGEAMAWRAMTDLAIGEGDLHRAARALGKAEAAAQRRLSRRETAHNKLCEARLRRHQGREEEAIASETEAVQAFASMGVAMPSWTASPKS
jgi:class 3 adenylate cyclase/tetratricopeptide (TPR) repeat protein